MEAKRIVERSVANEDREESEHEEEMELGDAQQLGRVTHLPVTKFVRENSLDFLVGGLFDQSIVNDNLLLPRETGEVSIAVSAALAAVDDLQLRQRKLETLSQSFDGFFERSWFQWSKLVEKRHDGDRVDGDGEELYSQSKDPKVIEEGIAGLLDNLEECPTKRNTESKTQGLSLEHICKPKTNCLLIEAIFLFQDKVVVVR